MASTSPVKISTPNQGAAYQPQTMNLKCPRSEASIFRELEKEQLQNEITLPGSCMIRYKATNEIKSAAWDQGDPHQISRTWGKILRRALLEKRYGGNLLYAVLQREADHKLYAKGRLQLLIYPFPQTHQIRSTPSPISPSGKNNIVIWSYKAKCKVADCHMFQLTSQQK